MLNALKHSVIVYNPGYAGNFLLRLFSLSSEVFPNITVKTLQDSTNKLESYSTDERLKMYLFSNVRSNYLNWQKFHREWIDFMHYDNLNSLRYDANYSHIIFAMHIPELELHSNNLKSIGNVDYFYVDLDLEKYGNWVTTAQKDLNFKYRMDETFKYSLRIKESSTDQIINLTAMLDSQDTFLQEYHRICTLMSIIPVDEQALILYKDWYTTRVAYYLD